METQSLWPDFAIQETKSPSTILKEQAAFLSEKTKNILVGEVRLIQNTSGFTYEFNIVAPALRNYRFQLLTVNHGIMSYPATVEWEIGDMQMVDQYCQDENEFTNEIKVIFNHIHTVKLISSLYSQSIANG